MQRSGSGQSVGWTIASIPFHTAPGIGWRLHISKIAAETHVAAAEGEKAGTKRVRSP
jgi:hypothetical protein